MGTLSWQSFSLPSCLKKRVLKPKCAVTNVDWNNLTFEFSAKEEQNLLGTTSNYLRSSQGTTRNFRTFQGLDSLSSINTPQQAYIVGYMITNEYKTPMIQAYFMPM